MIGHSKEYGMKPLRQDYEWSSGEQCCVSLAWGKGVICNVFGEMCFGNCFLEGSLEDSLKWIARWCVLFKSENTRYFQFSFSEAALSSTLLWRDWSSLAGPFSLAGPQLWSKESTKSEGEIYATAHNALHTLWSHPWWPLHVTLHTSSLHILRVSSRSTDLFQPWDL